MHTVYLLYHRKAMFFSIKYVASMGAKQLWRSGKRFVHTGAKKRNKRNLSFCDILIKNTDKGVAKRLFCMI